MKNRELTEEEISFIKENKDKSYKFFEQKFQINEELMKKKIKNLGIERNFNEKWDETSINFLKENYNKIPVSEIAVKLNRTEYAVFRKATKLKLLNRSENVKLKRKLRGFTLDENFFEIPNKLNSYWAGFLAADGCFDSKRNRITIGLAEKDLEHLLLFVKNINFNGKITKREQKCSLSKNKDEIKIFYALEITSKKIINDLKNNFNFCEKKTLYIQSPINLSKELSEAYCIGFIDGDGSIMKRKDNVLILSIIGKETHLEWMRKVFYDIVKNDNLNKINITQPKNQNIAQVLKFSNKTWCTDLLKYLNEIDVPKLKRKWCKI